MSAGARTCGSVLVGFAEALAAPEVVWSLLDAGFKVTAFARRGHASAIRASRYVDCVEVHAPEEDAAAAVADVQSLIESVDRRPAVLLPMDDAAVWLCSQVDLPSTWTLAGPRGQTARLALNKCLQIQAAERAGFNVPATRLVCTAQQLGGAVGDAEFPVIVKGSECAVLHEGRLRGSRTWICADRDELDRAAAQWDERVPLLVQPYIEGTGEGVFGIAGPMGVQAWSGHKRIRMMNPQGSGASACVSVQVSDDLKANTAALVEQNGWRGLFMVELLRDTSGRAWFMELNGRSWGSMALARRQGLEYPAWQVSLAMGVAPDGAIPNSGAAGVVCRNIGRELMHVLFVLRGPKSKALQNWPSLWHAVAGVTSIHPGDGLYNWRRDDPAVFLRDCYYTVRDNLFKRRT